MTYTRNPTPGLFQHRGSDCATHGENVPHARPFGGSGKYDCVECLLVAAKQLAQSKALAPAFDLALGEV